MKVIESPKHKKHNQIWTKITSRKKLEKTNKKGEKKKEGNFEGSFEEGAGRTPKRRRVVYILCATGAQTRFFATVDSSAM